MNWLFWLPINRKILNDWFNWSPISWNMDWLAWNIVFVSDFQSIEEEWCQPMRASIITSWAIFFNMYILINKYSKVLFSYPYIFVTLYRRPYIFKTMNYIRSNDLNLKYERCTSSFCKDIGRRKIELLAKTQFPFRVYVKKVL